MAGRADDVDQDRVQHRLSLGLHQRIGHPSCEGGFADAMHLHIARRFNGEWILAGSGPTPFALSGWTTCEGQGAYDGALTKGDATRTAGECMLDDYNGFVSDNLLPPE